MAEDKKLPAFVGFKPAEKDLARIDLIKQSLPAPEQISTAQILRMALAVWAEQLNSK